MHVTPVLQVDKFEVGHAAAAFPTRGAQAKSERPSVKQNVTGDSPTLQVMTDYASPDQ
jgi:hypothetical protein